MPIYRITRELIDEVSSGFAALHALNLSHNLISHVENLESLPGLRKLDLSHNRLGLGSIEGVRTLAALEALVLSANQMCAPARRCARPPASELVGNGACHASPLTSRPLPLTRAIRAQCRPLRAAGCAAAPAVLALALRQSAARDGEPASARLAALADQSLSSRLPARRCTRIPRCRRSAAAAASSA
ncbi:hypothetical protein T492DRAFT_1084161 [Pavlovales sp. CCMP2436]|nr:hypothetical protein T492DRAFT_1084161 [Pavlovales sp. CCMP2436]